MTAQDPITEAMRKDDQTPSPWSDTLDRLEHPEGEVFHWLSTVRADGRPHIVPVAAVWIENAFYFTTGQGTQKEANLAHDARCSMAFAHRGMNLVVEGTASRLTDQAMLERVAERYNGVGWPVTVNGDVLDAPYHAPTTGPGPYHVFKITPTVVYGFGTTEETHEHSARYRFATGE
jgi:hypothetical protein